MIISSTEFAIDFLSTYNLSRDTIRMMNLVFTIACLNILCIDSEEL